MSAEMKKRLVRIIVALVCFAVLEVASALGAFAVSNGLWIQFACFLVPYLIAGYDVLGRAVHGIVHGQVFDENFLMAIASLGAFCLVFFPDADPHMAEGTAVMIFYQVGELFQDYAVGKSRKSIAAMMDIAPEYANVRRNGELMQVDPYDVEVDDEIVVKPGERVPLDGVVISGNSQLDTAALTGESVPRVVEEGAEVVSGCVNMTGLLVIRVSKPYGESTVQRILELVEEASERKARTENFITRFARYYTPIVCGLALALAVLPPLLVGQSWSSCVQSALVFLVVSCPCALVISVPLSFFGGIGAASKLGILVKGSSYLETLGHVDTVVFDKTGTLTNGSFNVVAVHTEEGIDPDLLLSFAAHAEAYSDHPIALSVKERYSGQIDPSVIEHVEELGGRGVKAEVEKHLVLVGNDKLMAEHEIDAHTCELVGTILHVALDGTYIGHIVIADVMKPDAQETVERLHAAGITKTVMLTGDRNEVAAAVAKEVGVDEYRAQLLPQDKVANVEDLLAKEGEKGKLAFVGDGINDAPVLMRADVGIAMGAMGSDAAIEAADIVLMDDKPSKIASAIKIAHRTMRIVWQNIIFAIGVKILIMILALPIFGIATMWMAVFGDVGVACLAILNAMRALRIKE
ncbi:MAG: heavy metal translocating P-type ATPase [Coriobacteriales bacterium]|jgi:Cd2+/Zn2+-exporting ATPase